MNIQNFSPINRFFSKTTIISVWIYILIQFTTTVKSFGQGIPVIKYTSPVVFTTQVPITPLVPVNTGGAVPTQAAVTAISGLSNPKGVAFINSTSYVADSGNRVVRKLAPGTFNTVVIGGFLQPKGVTCDASNIVDVVDAGDNTIKEIGTPGGTGAIQVICSTIGHPYGITKDPLHSIIYVTDDVLVY